MDVYKTWLEDGSQPRIDPDIFSLIAREGAFDSYVFVLFLPQGMMHGP